VRAPVLRLPPTVHGDGDHGFVPHLIKLAREKGVSAYLGDGQNRWPAVHRLDAARLYRLAIEDPAAAGPFHAVAETGVEFRRIAAAIGKGLGLPVISVPAERATEHFGWFAHFAALDNPASSSQTRERLDWSPDHRALLDDLEHGTYFDV
jgi:nucleoside-diphosphate-sugar epimerase